MNSVLTFPPGLASSNVQLISFILFYIPFLSTRAQAICSAGLLSSVIVQHMPNF